MATSQDPRFWKMRQSYPQGIKLGPVTEAQCKSCGMSYGRRRRLPRQLEDGSYEPCINKSWGGCGGKLYTLYRKYDIEAMPIGHVRLPGRKK